MTETGQEAVKHGASEQHRAFRALYDRTQLQVLSYCLRRTADTATAVDVASETYAVAWRRFGDVPSTSDGDALVWLFAVAKRVLANQRRSQHRQARVGEQLAGTAVPVEESAEQSVIDRADRERVLVALQQLSDDDQELLRLEAWEGLSGAELAASFGCTENAIYVRLHRARRRLARAFDGVGRRATTRRRREAGDAS